MQVSLRLVPFDPHQFVGLERPPGWVHHDPVASRSLVIDQPALGIHVDRVTVMGPRGPEYDRIALREIRPGGVVAFVDERHQVGLVERWRFHSSDDEQAQQEKAGTLAGLSELGRISIELPACFGRPEVTALESIAALAGEQLGRTVEVEYYGRIADHKTYMTGTSALAVCRITDDDWVTLAAHGIKPFAPASMKVMARVGAIYDSMTLAALYRLSP